ncbi:MAG: phosphoenolpyruvate--protein phosphotransferase [Pseudomonadota bacterium]
MKGKSLTFRGLAASPGVALGYAHQLDRGKVVIARRSVDRDEVAFEIARFNSALQSARDQLKQLRKKVSDEQGEDHVYLIDAQILMLEDRSLTDDTREMIQAEGINAEWAVQKSIEQFKKLFDRIDDEYFRDRRSDIEYAEERLLRLLVGTKEQGFVSIHRKTVLVAHEISPADLLKINRESLSGVTMDGGGRTSHISIIARSFGIPMVVGSGMVSFEVQNGERIIVDGTDGVVIVRPEPEVWTAYEAKQKQYLSARKELLKNRHHKAETKDLYEVHLLANIDLAEEVEAVLENGAEGVGLLRTEYAFLGKTLPVTEEEQFESYKEIVSALKPRETVIRVLDVAGDSLVGPPTGFRSDRNPALGLRGIRFLLQAEEVLRTQLRAILRASAFGKAAILYPMVSTVEEVRKANQILRDLKGELEAQKIPFDREIRTGTMIEIPSAALSANQFAAEVDFLSIGTNDLIQYTMAVDRGNELVADLYTPLHGAFIQLLRRVADLGHKSAIEVGVCGEMASEPFFIPLLVGMEFNFLSVNAASIPKVKQIIRETTMADAKKWVNDVCRMDDTEEIRAYLTACYRKHLPGLWA